MPVFTKKSVDVEMIQWTGDNLSDVRAFISPLECTLQGNVTDQRLSFYATKAQATVTIERGDWIAKERDESGFYPVSNHDHADSYEGPKVFEPSGEVLDWCHRMKTATFNPATADWLREFITAREEF